MRTLLMCLVVLLVGILCGWKLNGQDIPNGSMDEPLDAWKAENNAVVTQDKSIFKKGPASLCLESNDTQNKDCKTILHVPIQRRGSFFFTGFYRVEGENLEGGALGILFFDENWQIVGEWNHILSILPGNQEWQDFKKEIVIPEQATRMLIILTVNGKGRVWLDELNMVQKDE